MSLIVRTAKQIAAEATAARTARARAKCERRILAVASRNTQTNIIGAAAAGLFSPPQMAAYVASLAWIAAMRAAWPPMAADPGRDIDDDAEWPACPPEVVALAAAF